MNTHPVDSASLPFDLDLLPLNLIDGPEKNLPGLCPFRDSRSPSALTHLLRDELWWKRAVFVRARLVNVPGVTEAVLSYENRTF